MNEICTGQWYCFDLDAVLVMRLQMNAADVNVAK